MKKISTLALTVIFLALFIMPVLYVSCGQNNFTFLKPANLQHCPMDRLVGLPFGYVEFIDNISSVNLPIWLALIFVGLSLILVVKYNLINFSLKILSARANLWQAYKSALARGLIQGKICG